MSDIYRIYFDKGYNFFVSRNYKEAKKNFKEALKIRKDDLNLLTHYGLTEANLGNYSKAHDLCSKAYEINPKDSNIVNNFALSNIWIGEDFLAENILTSHLKLNPLCTLTRSNLGKLLMNQGKLNEAIEVFKIIPSTNQNLDLCLDIAKCHELIEQTDEATFFYKRALNIDPRNLTALSFINRNNNANGLE